MKRLVVLLLLLSLVFADGGPVSISVTATVPEMRQTSQVAFIEWDGQEYTTDLYVTISPSDDEFYWIVPFQETPKNVELIKTGAQEHSQRIQQFKDDVFKSKNSKYLASDAAHKHAWIALANPITLVIGAAAFPLVVVPMLSMVGGFSAPGGGSGGAVDATPTPIKTFELGELGKAEVYDATGATLTQFFESKGVAIPSELEKYSNKKVVVFTLNKLDQPTSLLASFTFDSQGKIFYPSSTTPLWKDYKTQEFALYIKAPKDYTAGTATPRNPISETNNHQNTFLYYYGNDAVFNEDIEVQMTPQQKDFGIAQTINWYLPLDWITAGIMLAITWLSPYLILKKLGADWKKFWRYCLYAFIIGVFIWPFFNLVYLL